MANYKRKKKPRIQESEIIKEVYNRTAIDKKIVKKILNAYFNVIEESINYGVEVKTPLGVFTWKDKAAHAHTKYFDPKKKEFVEKFNVPGFFVPSFRPALNWKKELKEATLYEYDDKKEKEKEE